MSIYNDRKNYRRYNHIINCDDINMYDEKFNIIGKCIRNLKINKYLGNDTNTRHYYDTTCLLCGDKIIIEYSQLFRNKYLCNCQRKYQFRTSESDIHQLYRKWYHMRDRCNNPNDNGYFRYGGRGIKVCAEWNNVETGFNNFYKWAIDNGWKPNLNLSIDRIDTNGDYCPENCRWGDRKIQSANRRNLHYIQINNHVFPLSIWCELIKIKYMTVYNRIIVLKWNYKDALFKGSNCNIDNIIIPKEYEIYNKYNEFLVKEMIEEYNGVEIIREISYDKEL